MNILFKKIELLKFQKLVNNNDIVLFTDGNIINYLYNKKTKKHYYPKNNIIIVR